jgi:hypothetical protein
VHEDSALRWQKFFVSNEGEDIEIHSNLLPFSLMQQLAREKRQEANLTPYRIRMDILPTPWLKKGYGLNIDDVISDGLGNEIDLSTMTFLITKVRTSGAPKAFTSNMDGVAWLEKGEHHERKKPCQCKLVEIVTVSATFNRVKRKAEHFPKC